MNCRLVAGQRQPDSPGDPGPGDDAGGSLGGEAGPQHQDPQLRWRLRALPWDHVGADVHRPADLRLLRISHNFVTASGFITQSFVNSGSAGFGFHAEAPAEGLTVQASLPSTTPDGLSLADVARLMDQPSVANRIDTAEKVAEQIRAGKLTEPAEEMAIDILMRFAQDAEVAVRQAVAWQFRNNDRLPEDLAIRLAEDVAEVAAPVLSYHAGFEDAFLTSVIGTGDQLKMAAIAVRRRYPRSSRMR